MEHYMNDTVLFEKRKIVGNTVIETYKYKVLETKDHFFKHYKTMQARRFKNDRNSDFIKDNYLFVTYIKNFAATKKE